MTTGTRLSREAGVERAFLNLYILYIDCKCMTKPGESPVADMQRCAPNASDSSFGQVSAKAPALSGNMAAAQTLCIPEGKCTDSSHPA